MADEIPHKSLFDTINKKYVEQPSVERSVQVDGILRLVDSSIEKLKISLVLPHIFKNLEKLPQYLKGTAYEDVMALVERYLKSRRRSGSGDPIYVSYDLIRLIDYFHNNYEMIKYLPDWLSTLNSTDKSLLEAFYLLKLVTEQRLYKSAVEELAKEKKIHTIYLENEKMKKSIQALQDKLRNERITLRWKLAAKDGIIKKYEDDLAYKKWDNSVRIKQEVVKSSRTIRAIHAASVQKHKELEEELEKAKTNYEKTLKQNLQKELEARAEKNKLLLQLHALIGKYDQNIGERIKKSLELQEEYDEQKRQFDEFMIEFRKEEQEYESFVKAKEEEDRRKFEDKLMIFLMQRAARVIQKYWRRYRRLKAKSEKKRGKGKRK